MTRQTSIEVYHKIQENGLLSAKRMEVYDTLFYNGPMTSGEAVNMITKNKPKEALLNQSRARFTELRDMGCIYEVGTRECKISGNVTLLWDVTTNLPSTLPKNKTRKQKVDEILDLIKCLGKDLDFDKDKTELRKIYYRVKDI